MKINKNYVFNLLFSEYKTHAKYRLESSGKKTKFYDQEELIDSLLTLKDEIRSSTL